MTTIQRCFIVLVVLALVSAGFFSAQSLNVSAQDAFATPTPNADSTISIENQTPTIQPTNETSASNAPITGMSASSSEAVETFYGGYHTVSEHYQHLDRVVQNYPLLAKIHDYGDSYLKTQGQGGYDLKVICLTKLQTGECEMNLSSTKPRFFLLAGIHPRELVAPEIAYRWIDYLVQNYNVDPVVTMILDYSEVWVVPLANPDGSAIVESGGSAPYYQRKNARPTYGFLGIKCASGNPPDSDQKDHIGIDLNRNASTNNWGDFSQYSKDNPCDQEYPGAYGGSEPEVGSLGNLFRAIYPDNKSIAKTDSANPYTKGLFISLHSTSNFVIFPNGDSLTKNNYTPDDLKLRSLAYRMTYFNDYAAGTADEVLYDATGSIDDWLYNELGIPSFTYEIGPDSGDCSGFMPIYTCVDAFWSLNRSALRYAASVAQNPYSNGLGPSPIFVNVSIDTVIQGSHIFFDANLKDTAYGTQKPNLKLGARGRPESQNVNTVEYSIDVPPFAGGTTIPMAALDGTFDSSEEYVRVAIPTQYLSVGRHKLYVRGRDSDNNWGPVSTVFFTVTAPIVVPPTNTPTSILYDGVSLISSPSTSFTASRSQNVSLTWTFRNAGTAATTVFERMGAKLLQLEFAVDKLLRPNSHGWRVLLP